MNTHSAVFPLIAAAAVYFFRVIELRTRRQTIRGPVKENLTLKLFILAGTAMFSGGLLEFLFRGQRWSWLSLGLGVACALISFTVRHRAIAALGRFWSLHVEIRENHEFLADHAVINTGVSRAQYKQLLLNQVVGSQLVMTNNFNTSLIKNRIQMITKIKSSKLARFKYLVAFIPVIALVVFFVLIIVKSGPSYLFYPLGYPSRP